MENTQHNDGDETQREKTQEEGELHKFRTKIDANILKAEHVLVGSPQYAREMALVRTKLQEAKMWVGKCLEVLGSHFPKELRDHSEDRDSGVQSCE
jgi:hypothetical protein|tara:strand:- start:11656 stop:11943 length:288 start_codon:yes stop_codon:yes gene_type:complete